MPRLPAVRPDFPLGRPTWPTTIPRDKVVSRTGVHYETEWARTWPARLARALIVDDILRPAVHLLGSPRVEGREGIEDLASPVIFAANHHSHLDAALLLTSLPERFRHRAVVAAGADYFFTSRPRSALSALTIGAIPIDRMKVNRRSADLAASLLDEGWNLVIFPEGGRSSDGWGREFRGGAAYLSLRCGRPVIPVHLQGTRRVLKKGDVIPRPVGGLLGKGPGVRVTFGRPMRPGPGEDARRFSGRIELAVAALADEVATDWWTARRRAASTSTPPLRGPDTGPWRRSWALESDRRAPAGHPEWP